MDRVSHRPSCAKRLRQEGTERGETVHEIARNIHIHCSVSPLRAQRLARGMTLKEAAERLNVLGRGRAAAPRVDADQLGHWETGRQPRPATVELLCDLYECVPQDLVLASASLVPTAPPSPPSLAMQASAAHMSLEQHVDAARREVDRTLATGTVTATQVDLLDEQLLWAREQYVYTPPAPMLQVLLGQLKEVSDLAAQRQPAAVQVRLSELTAMLATLIADALMKLGHLTRAQSWYATARNAAEDSGNPELRARVRAQAAMLPYYYGPLEAAVSLSREARILCRGRPGATTAFSSAAEARALAKLGNTESAMAALRSARAAFEQTRDRGTVDNDAFGFPERRLRLYESGTLTALGQTSQARRVQEAALRLYPAKTGIDPALLHFEAAICLAHDGSPTEACQLAAATFLRMVPGQRTPIVEKRAREVIEALPPGKSGRGVRELREILARPTGPM
ncbi:helix-turn-helix transcriptional regulator [Streptomyces smyrnaeus]|uniref:Helix-turn-helix transcriptional regulator n=2 Tax=Streptomyces smyrnaeus TaxID=1387713 RepID=A0ABS3Y4Y3_9ACTN|nr:helix-turn-helix transcriptional regulator [Streptomyces smyrnaeus]MBO8202724.1 helix-turn-helix transcriptional regulator [Streptomyces smyrnaeus]